MTWLIHKQAATMAMRLPVTMTVSVAAHTVMLFAAPLFFVTSALPPRAVDSLHVELAPAYDAGAAPVPDTIPLPTPSLKKPHTLRRHREQPIHTAAPSVTASAPSMYNATTSSPASPPPTNEPLPTEAQANNDAQSASSELSAAHEAPAARFAPAPVYPDEARWERRAGRVVLYFNIRRDGTVERAQVLDSSGHADLDHAAVTALRAWRFDAPSAAMLDARYRYAFRFDLM